MLSAPISVDTFFMLSGLFVSYTMLKHMEKTWVFFVWQWLLSSTATHVIFNLSLFLFQERSHQYPSIVFASFSTTDAIISRCHSNILVYIAICDQWTALADFAPYNSFYVWRKLVENVALRTKLCIVGENCELHTISSVTNRLFVFFISNDFFSSYFQSNSALCIRGI